MDSFLTKLFEEPQCNPELLGEEPWIFSCKCNKYCSSNNPNTEVEVRFSSERWQCNLFRSETNVRLFARNNGLNVQSARFGHTFAAFTLISLIQQLKTSLSRCCATVVPLRQLEANPALYPVVELGDEVAPLRRVQCAAVWANGRKLRLARRKNRQKYQPQPSCSHLRRRKSRQKPIKQVQSRPRVQRRTELLFTSI